MPTCLFFARRRPFGTLTAACLALPLLACSHVPRAPASAASPVAKPALYEQLGGVAAVEALGRAMVQRLSSDARTQRTFEGVNRRTLAVSLGAHLCVVADGPCVYEGETMKNAHADLGLKGSDFEVAVQMLREELDRAGVAPAAKNELLRRLAPTRRDIVTIER